MLHVNNNQKDTVVAILISDKADIRTRKLSNIKRSIT